MVLGNCFWVEEAVDESEAPDLSGENSVLRGSCEDWSLCGGSGPGGLRGACQPEGPGLREPGPNCGARQRAQGVGPSFYDKG